MTYTRESSVNTRTKGMSGNEEVKSKTKTIFNRNFQYLAHEYPHVTQEAVDYANKDPQKYTPNGAQRMLDIKNGVNPVEIARREQANPPPESEKNRPQVNRKFKSTEKPGTEYTPDETDKVGRAKMREDMENAVEAARQGFSMKDKEEKEYYSLYQLWEMGMQHFQAKMPNLVITYTGKGDAGGFEFGIKDDYPQIKGITPPPGTQFIKTLEKFDRSIFDLFATIPNVQAREFWSVLVNGNGDNSAIAKFSVRNGSQRTTKSISIDGRASFKMIPPMEWFSDDIKKIDPVKGLLAIFPEAEAHTLLIHLGKTAFGRHCGMGHENHIEDFVMPPDYKYRASVVFNGVPQIGKSTLMDLIFGALAKVGYTHSTMASEINRFSFSDCVLSDVTFLDDMSASSLKSILDSSAIKSISSGDPVNVDKKNHKPRDVYPTTTLFFSTNHVTFPSEWDRGVLDRLHFLTTYTHKQLISQSKERGVNLFTGDYWDNVSRELKIDKAALALYLVRCGLDMFLKEIGVSQNDVGMWIQDPTKKNNVGKFLNENRKKYLFKSPVDSKESISNIARKSYLISSIFLNIPVPEQYKETFSAFTLLHIARTVLLIDCTKDETIKKIAKRGKSWVYGQVLLEFLDELSSWLMPPDETVITTMIWSQFVSIWRIELQFGVDGIFEIGGEKKKNFENMFRSMVPHLTDLHGGQIEQNRSAWTQCWLASGADDGYAENQLREILKKYDEVLDFKNNEDLTSALAQEFLMFRASVNRSLLV